MTIKDKTNDLLICDGYKLSQFESMGQDELDDLVLDFVMNEATEKMNEVECEEKQEEILQEYEQKASNINNGGKDVQIEYLAQ